MFCSRLCLHVSRVVLTFWRKKAHGMPFEGIPLAPSHAVSSEKGSRVARPQSRKVPTRGFPAKKEGVWRELSRTGADSRIFGEKGSCVARPLCHFSLADFQRKRKRCGATSLPFFTRGFSAKKEVVWRDLKNLANILYFFVYQHRLKDP